jgi:hypothetical protein
MIFLKQSNPCPYLRRHRFFVLAGAFFLLCVLQIFSVWAQTTPPLFRLLPPAKTGISFANKITENNQLNILNEAYIYNGGGVGIGDFNRDGKPDVYFSGNMVGNKLYLNKGGLQFADVTNTASVGGGGRWCTGVAVADVNADGWDDIYVSATFLKDPQKRTNLLYINEGTNAQGIPVFKEMARQYGLADTGYSTQGYFFDYDKDNDLDLFLLTNTLDDPKTPIQFRPKVADGSAANTDRLYRNNGNNTFTDVSKEAGILLEGWGHAASISDINRDGWPDIYVSNDFVANDICYINNGDGTFTDRITEYFRHTSWYTMGTDIADINNDGYVDVVALDMLPETNLRKKGMLMGNEYYNYFNSKKYNYQHQYVRNVLQLNAGATPEGKPLFSDVGLMAGIYETDWSWSPLVADFDNDGFRDIVITNGLPRDVTDLDYISYDNGQGAGAPNTSLKMVDALPIVKVANYAFKNKEGFLFENATRQWGLNHASFSNGAAYADLDGDGDLDILINNINETAFIYENTVNKGSGNFLTVSLLGAKENPQAYGSTVRVFYNKNKQLYYEHQPNRGYLSSMDAKAHFGLGAASSIDSILVQWPDGKWSRMQQVAAGSLITIKHSEAIGTNYNLENGKLPALFQEVNAARGILYKHQEKDAVDYNIQPTLPHKLSQFGPAIAVGDINGNGREDFYVAAPAGSHGVFFIQDSLGRFQKDGDRFLIEDNSRTEEVGVLLFDADSDGDLDLYAVCGSYEFAPNNSGNQDRLYRNDGKGHFTWDVAALPKETANGSCVRAFDFDGDGDLDLFVGGRSTSGAYPIPPQSFLLQNDGGKFTDVTQKYCPQLQNIGMVTDALWTDFNTDGKFDLVLTGEWMPVTFLQNTGSGFSLVNTGIEQWKGWWNSLAAGDFDNDGDMDYVAGNLGLNSTYKATQQEPMLLLAKDLDNNGKLDPMVFCFMMGANGQRKLFPMHTKDDLSSQLVSIRKTYPTYKSFGFASVDELWPKATRADALSFEATQMATSYLQNLGGGKFRLTPLPTAAQTAPVFGMVAEDVDRDGNLDLVMVGNDYGMEPGSGRHDAFNGLLLQGKGDGTFTSTTPAQSGFMVKGDGKSLATIISVGGKPLYVASQNNDSLLSFQYSGNPTEIRSAIPEKNELWAEIEFKDGKKRRVELYYGFGFLSQSTRQVGYLQHAVSSITFYDQKGIKTRVVRVLQ